MLKLKTADFSYHCKRKRQMQVSFWNFSNRIKAEIWGHVLTLTAPVEFRLRLTCSIPMEFLLRVPRSPLLEFCLRVDFSTPVEFRLRRAWEIQWFRYQNSSLDDSDTSSN
jgi:hypothetical protein